MNELPTTTYYKNIAVINTSQLAELYGTDVRTISNNFNRNKERYEFGKHFVCLEGEELKAFKGIHQNDESLVFVSKLYLWTEKGAFLHAKSLNTDKAWEVYDRLVETYFHVRKIANEELSPQTQFLLRLAQTIANKELEDRERDRQIALANETAKKAVATTENIKEAVKPVLDNWRDEINKKVKRIQFACKKDFQTLNAEMYFELERRAGCDLGTRLRNLKQRMYDVGRTKTEINNTRKIDVIESDKKLREIFSKIVLEYEIKYCA